ncbi:MEDS domain-containing protein [Allorhizocola rhizosphaerae]|uniref:MEDS domain-containing protein n=1 Tax=Allorhizocola rhizosphaerae TaxID=1872709 RepID=UPI0013C2A16C|nr:MEDS domain-containing protein [Allorhizocola rhizosphaerae]
MSLVITDDESWLVVAADYVSDGLQLRHKIILCTDMLRPEALIAGLEYLGVANVWQAQADGQLEVMTAEQSYLAAGRFDPEETITAWAGEIDMARRQGYAALRMVGDMGWALRPAAGVEPLARYEVQINRVFAQGHAMAVCLYDRRLFTTSELAALVAAHPATATCPPPSDWEPTLRMRYLEGQVGARLSGEVDVSNRQAVAAMLSHLLDHLAAADAEVVLDLSELRLIDGATAALLVRTVQKRANLRLVGRSQPVAALMDLVSGATLAAVIDT